MDMKIRIQAAAIRSRLIARHSNETFRRVLKNMTDAELVEREAQFHADALAAKVPVTVTRHWDAKKVGTTHTSLVSGRCWRIAAN